MYRVYGDFIRQLWQIGKKRGGDISVGEFKVHQGIIPILERFDFETNCKVSGFEFVRLRDGDATVIDNRSGKYQSDAKRLRDSAQRGDVFLFNKVKVKCPGDIANRQLNGLIFNIR